MTGSSNENIRRVREARGWSQKQLAGLADLELKTVQRAEARDRIALKAAQAIACALHISRQRLEGELGDDEIGRLVEQYIVLPATVVERGRDADVLLNAHFMYFAVEFEPTQAQLAALTGFQQLLDEWIDRWTELTPAEKRSAQRSFLTEASALRKRRIWVRWPRGEFTPSCRAKTNPLTGIWVLW